MNYFFSKDFYERAIAEEKKDSYYCEVSIKDFKGKKPELFTVGHI